MYVSHVCTHTDAQSWLGFPRSHIQPIACSLHQIHSPKQHQYAAVCCASGIDKRLLDVLQVVNGDK